MNSPTNAQAALAAAVQSMTGLYPSGKSSYTADDLSASRVALADNYLKWLENADKPRTLPERDERGRFLSAKE